MLIRAKHIEMTQWKILWSAICEYVQQTLDEVFTEVESTTGSSTGIFRMAGFEYENGVQVNVTIQKPLEYSLDME